LSINPKKMGLTNSPIIKKIRNLEKVYLIAPWVIPEMKFFEKRKNMSIIGMIDIERAAAMRCH